MLARETLKGLANRRRADADAPAERGLGDDTAGLELERHDELLDAPIGLFVQRPGRGGAGVASAARRTFRRAFLHSTWMFAALTIEQTPLGGQRRPAPEVRALCARSPRRALAPCNRGGKSGPDGR